MTRALFVDVLFIAWVLSLPLLPHATARAAVSDARSDLEIEEAIRNELIWSVGVQADRIAVEVTGGVATLTGTVQAPAQVEQAIRSAYLGGAWRVINRLVVLRAPGVAP